MSFMKKKTLLELKETLFKQQTKADSHEDIKREKKLGIKNRLAGNTLLTAAGFAEGSEKGSILKTFAFLINTGEKIDIYVK